jgi:hypothetical protein
MTSVVYLSLQSFRMLHMRLRPNHNVRQCQLQSSDRECPRSWHEEEIKTHSVLRHFILRYASSPCDTLFPRGV